MCVFVCPGKVRATENGVLQEEAALSQRCRVPSFMSRGIQMYITLLDTLARVYMTLSDTIPSLCRVYETLLTLYRL